MNRSDEIAAKKAKLAELKRQREERQRRQSSQLPTRSTDEPLVTGSPLARRTPIDKDEVNRYVDDLIGDTKRHSLTAKDGPASPFRSRPSSVVSATQVGHEGVERRDSSRQPGYQTTSIATQTSAAIQTSSAEDSAPSTIRESFSSVPNKEIITYSIGTQTSDPLPDPPRRAAAESSESDDDLFPSANARSPRNSRLYGRRDFRREEELRQQIRREVEEELKAIKDPTADGSHAGSKARFPARNLTQEEATTLASSDAFADFVDRAGKVVERALDSEYDLLADYAALDGFEEVDEDEDEGYASARGKKSRKLKEIAQFYDQRWSRRRMISDVSFSPKSPELLLASYTKNPSAPQDPSGLVQLWSMHLRSRPEYIFHSTSDILTAQFSPFHPRYIIGGTYTGQVLLWDMRDRSPLPRLKTPLAGASAAGGSYGGHTHPIYSISQIGTQNANNIMSCSTDGVVCGWTTDMLTAPQESLELTQPPTSSPMKFDDLAPTCMSFPATDPTSFLVGTEEGTIFPCHRYDRAGAKAGVDGKIRYKGHTAPVTGLDFHSAKGPVDLGDLAISSSLDWSIKIWKVRGSSTAGAATSSSNTTNRPSIGYSSSSTTTNPVPTSSSLLTNNITNPPLPTSEHPHSQEGVLPPLLTIPRSDVLYSVRWSPTHPSVFALVDGAGRLEIFDLLTDTEVPVCSAIPDISRVLSGGGGDDGVGGGEVYADMLPKSLNKVAWEGREGKRVVVGGASGVVSVFEVPGGLGGGGDNNGVGVGLEEWRGVKRLVGRAEREGGGGGRMGMGMGMGTGMGIGGGSGMMGL